MNFKPVAEDDVQVVVGKVLATLAEGNGNFGLLLVFEYIIVLGYVDDNDVIY